MTHEPRVKIPVQCATCKAVAMVEFPVIVVVTALTVWNNMRLYTRCHDVSWSATAAELNRIREHLGSFWIEEQRARIKRALPELRKPPASQPSTRMA